MDEYIDRFVVAAVNHGWHGGIARLHMKAVLAAIRAQKEGDIDLMLGHRMAEEVFTKNGKAA